MELNNLIYTGAKLVCDKISVPLKNMNRHSKPGWEIQLETQIRNQQQAKMIRQRKNTETCWEKKKKATQQVK